MYLDFLHFFEGHIPKFPTIAHRNGSEADAFLGVVFQHIGGIGSHREKVASVCCAVADELLFCCIEFGKLLLSAVGHQIVSIFFFFFIFLILFLFLLILGFL